MDSSHWYGETNLNSPRFFYYREIGENHGKIGRNAHKNNVDRFTNDVDLSFFPEDKKGSFSLYRFIFFSSVNKPPEGEKKAGKQSSQ